MAQYVMSDIHGESQRFWEMLRRISFAPGDKLYILGDVIDRGTDGVELLEYILDAPDMLLLLGNHEQMCLECFVSEPTFVAQMRWARNGNAHTLRALQQMSVDRRVTLLYKMSQLPDHLDITVEDRMFHLVHGFPRDTTYKRLWTRPDYYTPNPFPDRTVIVGHTPVVAYAAQVPVRDHMQILHAPGFINVDCGCGHSMDTRRLACLRLEDMAEFYC